MTRGEEVRGSRLLATVPGGSLNLPMTWHATGARLLSGRLFSSLCGSSKGFETVGPIAEDSDPLWYSVALVKARQNSPPEEIRRGCRSVCRGRPSAIRPLQTLSEAPQRASSNTHPQNGLPRRRVLEQTERSVFVFQSPLKVLSCPWI